ncbi:MAG: hypothetical protein IIZ78_29010 [Clostridiales bacterium]|nr:hypothetical protein [Clostridiales bacterium]
MKGKTQSGFNVTVDEKRMEDIRFFELISEADENPFALPKLVTYVLGAEQKEKLYKHLEKDGVVAVTDVIQEMTSIFHLVEEKSQKAKNS